MKDQYLRTSLGNQSKYFFDQSFDYFNRKTNNKQTKKPTEYIFDTKKYQDYNKSSNYDTNSKLDQFNLNQKYRKLMENRKYTEPDYSISDIRKNNIKDLRSTLNCVPNYAYNDNKRQETNVYSPRQKDNYQSKIRKINSDKYQKPHQIHRSPNRKYDEANQAQNSYRRKAQKRHYYSPVKTELTISTVSHKKLASPQKYTNFYTPKYQKLKQQKQDYGQSKSYRLKQLLQKYQQAETQMKSPGKQKILKQQRQKYKQYLAPKSYTQNQHLSQSSHPSLQGNYKQKNQDSSLYSTAYSYDSNNVVRKYSRKFEQSQQFNQQLKSNVQMFKKKKDYYEGSSIKTPQSKLLYNKKQIQIDYEIKKINSIQRIQSVKKSNISIDDFIIGKNKGEGKFGVVFLVKHKLTGSLYALKKIQKVVIKNHMMQDQLRLQIKLQSYFNHPNILKLFGFFDDKEHIYLLLQYMQEGTLFEYLKRKKQKLSQKQVSLKIKQIANAIRYLHDLDIAHRDIKPQNIVLSNGVAKLCDFGWSTRCQNRRKTYCGTFDYAAPQILQGKQYDWCVDLWCLGVLTYQLLTGKVPFYNISRKQTMKKILNVDKNQIQFPNDISWQAKDFVQCLIKKDPHQRKRADQLFDHPFLQKYTEQHKYF